MIKFMFEHISWDKELSLSSLPFETKTFQILQTHISYVLITDEFVYKIKKPVNFGFLDFTTLEKRKFYCEREVELNRRLCGDLYIGVVPITKTNGGYQVEGKGEPVEYAVKMKRLPEEGMMKSLLEERLLTKKHMDLIVDTLVPFYKTAETGDKINYYGSIEVITFNTEENFEQTKSFIGKALTQRKYDYIVNYTRNFIKEKKEVFQKRIEGGFIRDGHGDLYSANICFDNLKRVYIFDCIEFNDRFRCGDCAQDLAFLAMDLDFHRLKELSSYFIEEYVKKSGDSGLYEVLNFYKCYRAYVRGKIGCFTYADERVPEEERRKALYAAQRYFDLAFSYAGGKPKIAVFMGLSGTGKTFLANKFLSKYPACYLSSDIERKKLIGISPEEHRFEEFEKGIYSPEVTEKTYKRLIERTLEEISFGRDVVLDATFREERYREELIKALKPLKIEPLFILCTAPDHVVKERIEKRHKERSASDALFETYLHQKKKFVPPKMDQNLLVLDTSQSLEILLQQIEKFLNF